MMIAPGPARRAELLDRRLGGIAGRQHHPEDGVARPADRRDRRARSAAAAPSGTRAAIAAASRSQTIVSCPARIRRLAMLPPIRPRPIIPMRMSEPLVSQARAAATSRPIVRKPGIHVSLDVDAQPRPAALGQHVEVAERLRQLDGPKARPVAGNGEVGVGFPGDLEEHAARRPALIGLAGRMEEARAEARPRSRRAGRPAPRSASR